MSSRTKEKFKRDREEESGPAVLPEVKPDTESCTAPSVVNWLVTEPRLTLEIGGEEYEFMVGSGAMVSVIQPGISLAQVQPCDVQARGVTDTQLEIIGEQKIEFKLKTRDQNVSFVHTFIVSPLERCSSGILGMDFLQSVGAEISLTAELLHVGRCSFPLKGQESEVATVQRLINGESEQTSRCGQEEGKDESEEDWEGSVELAEAVTVPPLSVRIARCRVVRLMTRQTLKSLGIKKCW